MAAPPNPSAVVKKIECPFAIKWEINENKLNEMRDKENGSVFTKYFNASNIPDVKYLLEIYPNGRNEETRGKVFIFLHLNLGNEKKVKAEYKVCIESALRVYDFKYEFDGSYGCGRTCFKTAKLFNPEKKFILNGKLTLKCQGTLNVLREVTDVTNKWEEQSFFGNLWKSQNYNDFTIVVDGKKIKTHRFMLRSQSPVFDGMFNSGRVEARENKMEITDFTYETVEAAIELMYDRKISDLNLEQKLNVFRFFDQYLVGNLIESLEFSLAENISLSTVLHISNFSLFSKKLQERCMNFMVACLRMDRPIDDFDNLNETFASKVHKNVNSDIVKT